MPEVSDPFRKNYSSPPYFVYWIVPTFSSIIGIPEENFNEKNHVADEMIIENKKRIDILVCCGIGRAC